MITHPKSKKLIIVITKFFSYLFIKTLYTFINYSVKSFNIFFYKCKVNYLKGLINYKIKICRKLQLNILIIFKYLRQLKSFFNKKEYFFFFFNFL